MVWGERVGRCLREWPVLWAAAGILSLLAYFFLSSPAPRLLPDDDELRHDRARLDAGAPAEAQERLETFLSLRPASPRAPEARLLLARAYLERARREPDAPRTVRADLAWNAAQSARASGHDAAACRAVEDDILEWLLRRGYEDRALARSRERLTPGDPELRLYHAELLAEVASRDAAPSSALTEELRGALAAILEDPARRRKGLLVRPLLYERLGDYERMLRFVDEGLAELPQEERLSLDRARALYRLGRDAEARLALGAASSRLKDPFLRDAAQLLRAQLLRRSGEPGLDEIAAELSSSPRFAPFASLLLAARELEAGAGPPFDRVEAALSRIRPLDVQELGFDFATFYAHFTGAWEREGDRATLERFAPAQARVRALFPYRARYSLDYARLLQKSGRTGTAGEAFAAAASSDALGAPEREAALRGAAEAFFDAGFFLRAADFYDRLFELRRKPEDLFRNAESLMKAGIYEGPTPFGPGAIDGFADYVASVRPGDPRLPQAILNRGRLLAELGRFDASVAEYDRILKDYRLGIDPRTPEWAEALLGRGRSLLEARRLPEARDSLEEYLERYAPEGGAAEASLLLARTGIARGSLKDAARALASLGPGEGGGFVREARFLKAEVHEASGEYEDAARAFGEAYRRAGDGAERLRGLLGRARALIRLGRKDEARRDYEIGLSIYGENRKAYDDSLAGYGRRYWSFALEGLERESR